MFANCSKGTHLVRIKGALHVHSELSHDGLLTIAELAGFYRGHGFDFIAIGEHSQDIGQEKAELLIDSCRKVSSDSFLAIPGIEYTCAIPGMHILGVGAVGVTEDRDPVRACRLIHEYGGWAVLAHPKRFGWTCASEVVKEIDAVEVWNVGYDGKFLPPAPAIRALREMRAINPKLLAVGSHDLHRQPGFYDLGVEMEVDSLGANSVLDNLRKGNYVMRSRFLDFDSLFRLGAVDSLYVRVIGPQLQRLRKLRNLAYRRKA